ncbi:hypothetical protein BCR41DRAFT_346165 [Lobosporangium transversale]|uniref:Uncharacterized protein n=1 Tax=Lobosporangium transversale TaxID=64571 RepID=A0A1Y2H035_9FUNG|nr:hypothetical protein BCR41DRAFT_346165 [Lobosporangium transversale]ORZ27875.1 hypothetical protein BCR41DRAFT_346165 [Lobosporangium transversale]|eukprot:XP_021885578.1 hypothetical protein BCR41DRAFT_346165 [Lobosporangium transversale]
MQSEEQQDYPGSPEDHRPYSSEHRRERERYGRRDSDRDRERDRERRERERAEREERRRERERDREQRSRESRDHHGSVPSTLSSQPSSPTSSRSSRRRNDISFNHTLEQSLDQTIEQLLGQTSKQTRGKTLDQTLEELLEQTSEHAFEDTIEDTLEDTSDQPTGRPSLDHIEEEDLNFDFNSPPRLRTNVEETISTPLSPRDERASIASGSTPIPTATLPPPMSIEEEIETTVITGEDGDTNEVLPSTRPEEFKATVAMKYTPETNQVALTETMVKKKSFILLSFRGGI